MDLTHLLLHLFQLHASQVVKSVRYVPESIREPKQNATPSAQAKISPPTTTPAMVTASTPCASTIQLSVEDMLVSLVIFANAIRVRMQIVDDLPSVAWMAPYEGESDLEA